MSTKGAALVDDIDDQPFACWCGKMITEADCERLTGGCGGLGTLHCDCGGDSICVCHNHYEVECPGCEYCDDGDDFADDDYDDGGRAA